MHDIDDKLTIPTLRSQFSLDLNDANDGYYRAPEIDLSVYDKVIVFCSGGKDSIACLLHLLDSGVPTDKIEAWHHDVDGATETFMDWPFMTSYNHKLCSYLNVPLYLSWLAGGFKQEMLKENSYSREHVIETPAGTITLPRDHKRSKPATRMKFPQQSASLSTRYCSSVLKIDIGRRALTNQSRFDHSKTLVVSGERREESPGRSRYRQFEINTTDTRNGKKARHVDTWRPVLDWDESQVWSMLEKHRIIPPIPYRLGYSRSSCQTCIFNSRRIWATVKKYFPERVKEIAAYEDSFGTAISRTGKNVIQISEHVEPIEISDIEALEQAKNNDYALPVVLQNHERWVLPPGAYSTESAGSI